MNLPRPAAFLGCVLLLLINGCSPPPARQSDAAARQGSTTDSALKSFLEPLFASQVGKDPLADPEYRGEMRAQWRLSTEARYAWLVRKLKLSPEIADQLYDLLAEQIFESLEGPVQSLRENEVPVLTPEYQSLKD